MKNQSSKPENESGWGNPARECIRGAGEILSPSAPVFDIQHLCTHDGPGMRTVVFLKGCPLRCTWCSNPEGQVAFPQLRWHSKKCTACFSCLEACGRNAVAICENEKMKSPRFDRSLCYECNTKDCMDNCPNDAIDIVGREITADELFSILKKEIRLWWNTGGGVTFSGGEPLLYPEFVEQTAGKLKQFSINIAVETSGFFHWQRAEKALELCDLIFFDIKTIDDEAHKIFTEKSNKRILANLKNLAAISPDKIVVSMPIIPGVTDTVEKVKSAGKYIAGLGIRRAKLLPYHRLSLGKYESLGMKYPHEKNNTDIGKVLVERMREELEGMGIEDCEKYRKRT